MREWNVPNYSIGRGSGIAYTVFEDRFESTTVLKECHDDNGRYNELREVNRRVIDASCLRTCRYFHTTGSKTLYSKNTFSFRTVNDSRAGCPPTLLRNNYVHRPSPRKPYPIMESQTHRSLQNGIKDINIAAPLNRQTGWVYYDPFLRFIDSIRATNFVFIRCRRFSGTVLQHRCTRHENGAVCDDDLVASLQVYIPVMIRLLPNIERLTISTHMDHELEREQKQANSKEHGTWEDYQQERL